MAGANDIRAGRAYVEAYLDKTKLTRGLKSVSGDLKAFGAGIASLGTKFMALGAGVVAPLLAATKHFADFGSQINDMAGRTGMSTNALSELGFAADMTGASIADVETATKRMQKAITEAKDGPLKSLQGMAPEDQFMAIAESLAKIEDPTVRTAKAMEAWGKSGTALLPMIGDLKALRAEAVRLGLSMGPEQAAAADAMGDAWDKVKGSLRGVVLTIGAALAPALTGIADKFATGVVAIRAFVAENKPLIVSIFAAGVAAVAAGAGLFVAGKAIAFVGTMFAATLAVIKGAVSAFGFLQSAALLLANPFMLVGVAAVALGGYILYATGAIGKAATWISSTFATLLSEVTSTFDVIAQSMAAGDLASAAKVGWAMIALQWQKGVSFLVSLWEWFKGIYDLATSGLAIGMINVSAKIQTIWADLCNWMHKTWVSMFSQLLQNDVVANVLSAMWSAAGSEASPESIKALGRVTAQEQPAKIDAATAKNKAQIEKDRQEQVDIIGGDINRRQADRNARIKAAQYKVDAARAEWEAAKGEAQRAAAGGGRKFNFDGMLEGIDMQAATGPKSTTRGTFSASALGGMGTGSLQERMTKAVEKSKDAMGTLVTLTRDANGILKRFTFEAQP